MKVWGALLAAGVLLAAGAAGAREAQVGDKFGDWVFECQARSASKSVCMIAQTIVTKNNGRRLLRVVLGRLGPKGEPTLVALAPLGIYLPAGIEAKVDDNRPMPLTVERCNGAGCEANVKLDTKQLDQIKAGKTLTVSFQGAPNAKPITVQVSLAEVSKGIAALQ